jgi:hypothetical protein
MSFGAGFLIIAASFVVHISIWIAGLLLIGYFGFARLDQYLLRRKRDTFHDEGLRKDDPEDSEHETLGNLSRIKLPRDEQIIVTRVAELLRRLPTEPF